jgi:aryl-alcohol dehydrogenase-like predicted oxidoreductase
LLAIAPNVLLIPGTRTRGHLAENLAAGGLSLSDHEMALLDREFDLPRQP